MGICSDLRMMLSERIHANNIRQILNYVRANNCLREFAEFIFDSDADVAYRALWTCNHLTDAEINSLPETLIVELIDAAMDCKNNGRRRLMLNLIYRRPVCLLRHVELLDFCLERSLSRDEPSGVRSVCLKLAYKLTFGIPELQNELRQILDIMDEPDLPPSLRCVRKNILRSVRTNRR